MTSATSFRDLTNRLGDYFGQEAIEPIPPIETRPVDLNPCAWPPCKHCGGSVRCEAYDPDTSAGLWMPEKGATQ